MSICVNSRSHGWPRAARISDPGWRKSFCERVPENARTLGLMKLKTRPPED